MGPKGAGVSSRSGQTHALGTAIPALLPGHLEEGKEWCPCWEGSPQGPLGCPVSTEKSDAARVSWKQAGEAGQDVEAAAEPQVLGHPRSRPVGPTVHGERGAT